MRENEVWVNTATAAKAGIANGQYVKLRNQDGAISNRDQGKGDATHPTRLRLHGLRLRPRQQGDEERVSKGCQRDAADDAVRDRSADGWHEPPQQFRDLGEGDAMTCPASEWSSTRASASAAWIASSPARRRTTSRSATAATGSRPRCAATFRRPVARDPLRALQPLRQPAVRVLLPDRRKPRRGSRQGRAHHREQVHRLQGLHRRVPVRRALHPSGRLRRQVHVLLPPDEGRQGPGVRVSVPDALHDVRRPRRPEERVSELLRTRRITRCCPRPAPVRASST